VGFTVIRLIIPWDVEITVANNTFTRAGVAVKMTVSFTLAIPTLAVLARRCSALGTLELEPSWCGCHGLSILPERVDCTQASV